MIMLRDRDALPAGATFLAQLDDDSLEPEYRRGAMLYIDTRESPRPGDAVVLVVHGTPLIAILLERSAATIRIRHHRIAAALPVSAVAAIHRVVPLADLLL